MVWPDGKERPPLEKVAGLFRARTTSLGSTLKNCGDNATVDKRFAAKYSCFPRPRIAGFPSHKIEGGSNCASAVSRTQIADIATDVQAEAIVMERTSRASISADEASR